MKDSIMYNFIYIKHKNRQNLSMRLEVRIVVALGERKRKTRLEKETDAGSGQVVGFSFFIWVLVTQESSSQLREISLSNILKIYYSANSFRNPGTCCSEETYPSFKEAEILKSKDGKNDQGITNEVIRQNWAQSKKHY